MEEFEGLSLVELLDLLEPLPAPDPVPMWPQTAGWIWLGLALLAVLGWAAYRWIRHRRANAYRRAALADLARAGDDPARIAAILRRTALAAFPREDVAGLIGADWLEFLDRSGGVSGFRATVGQALLRGPYVQTDPVPGLADMAAAWVRGHRGDRVPP